MTVRLAAAALCGVLAYALLRQQKPEYAPLAELATAAVLFCMVSGELSQLRSALLGALSAADVPVAFPGILLRVLGTALLTRFAADTARDQGMAALAGKVEFAGRVVMLGLALPVFRALAQLIADAVRA